MRSTISRLRKRLRDAGAPEEVIVTRAPGYMLAVPAEMTDVFRFERVVAQGRGELSGGRPSECIRVLAKAEGLWRGPAYSEVRDEPFARAEARRLEELLLLARETRIDAELTLGRHEAVIGELEAATSVNPMRERLWTQRMLALYRAGRQAEALRVFQDLRAILVAELGIEPGHDVTWMEHAILAQDPALDFAVPPEDEADPAAEPTSAAAVQGPGAGPRSTRAPSWVAPTSRRCCATGGRRCAPRPDDCSSSTVTRGSGRRASWPTWRARCRHRVRWCSGAIATRIPWRRSSPSPRHWGAISSRFPPTGSRACPSGS